MRSTLLALLLATTAAQADSVTVRISPVFVMPNGAARVQCHVPKNPENRKLRWGIELVQSEEVSLDGDAAPVTWERVIQHIPCDPGAAFCEITRVNAHVVRVAMSFQVVGC